MTPAQPRRLRPAFVLLVSALVWCNGLVAAAEGLEAVIDGAMADHFDRFEIAGAAVTVVRGGRVVLSKGYGYADLSAGVPVDPTVTLFSTASVAKLFTWTAVMQLVEQGAIDLDADVNTYLSAIRLPETFHEPVRVRHLLDHTAGFEDAPVVGLVAPYGAAVPDLETALLRWMPRRVRPPGEIISYSNYGAALAGQIVAEVSGRSWEAYIETFILDPLGMTRTSPRQPLPSALAADLATSYVSGPAGLAPTPFEYTTIVPSGGMIATTDDMARFMLAHLQHGRSGETRVLGDTTARRMHAQSFTHHPSLPGTAHGFWEGVARGGRYLYHGGDTSSYTKLVIVPDHDVGFYVAYNSPDGSVAREALTEAILDHVLPVHEADGEETGPEAQAAAASSRLDGLTGTYGDTRISVSTIAKLVGLLSTFRVSAEDGLLVTTIPGRGEQRWTQTAPLAFADVAGTDRIAFRVDEHGRATHVFVGAYPELSFAATPWFDRLELHGALFLVWLLAATLALVTWPAFGRVAPGAARPTAWSRLGRRLPAVAGLLQLVFVVILVRALLDFPALEIGLGPLLTLGLTLTLVAGALAIAGVLHALQAWRRRKWSTTERLLHTVVALACVVLTWQLHHWNLLGIRV